MNTNNTMYIVVKPDYDVSRIFILVSDEEVAKCQGILVEDLKSLDENSALLCTSINICTHDDFDYAILTASQVDFEAIKFKAVLDHELGHVFVANAMTNANSTLDEIIAAELLADSFIVDEYLPAMLENLELGLKYGIAADITNIRIKAIINRMSMSK